MTAADFLREVDRRAVPDRLYIEAVKIIEGQHRLIESMYERIDVMREILAKRAEKQH